ncbi:hypothetical protein Fot_03159 [Forsythia ovata]|uniref:Uncharacterized protein n=1 Tax=Forsythia ovata TaxID=205694 RepID=A0ABD1X8X2_9LAMI
MESEHGFKNQSLEMSRSESKATVGPKRGIVENEEMFAISQKRIKIRDLESVFRSEAQGGKGGSDAAHPVVQSAPRALDLNTNVGSVSNAVDDDTPECIEERNKQPTSGNEQMECNYDFSKSRGFKIDLNAEDISSSINHDPLYPYRTYEHSKSRDNSECGSSMGPLKVKDPMRVWKKMKQNGYLSTSSGAAPMAMPKPRARKSKNDVMKKNIELAKKEQVDRFAKVAAPSGLLNGLNPGIINHVRNSKQVHSIIEALVRSEKSENRHAGSKQDNQKKCSTKFSEKNDLEKTNCLGINSDVILSRSRQISRHPSLSKSTSLNSELTGGNGYSYKGETKILESKPSYCHIVNEDDGLALKLSSCVTIASENTSSLSNESANLTSTVTSLSAKAANVASQWLELINQDVKGRLEALRRSKKRVWAVINTELPCLMSREFSSNQENDLYSKGSKFLCPDKATDDPHVVRWRTMFGNMDKALSEEESQLESWLNQVKEMQLHCEPSFSKHSAHHGLQQTDPNNCRFREANDTERDLAVRAAAASIYSTCNFLLSMENQ